MKNVGIIGWRGMVGSVLMSRMKEEQDFRFFNPIFFSTSQIGLSAPEVGQFEKILQDAYDINLLYKMDIIITTQGGDYTQNIYKKLRETGWNGYWIDSASTLRMCNDSVIALDPINRNHIDDAIKSGIKNYIGGNCTVSLLLMALGGLFDNGLVEWISTMTYQAVSGAGAKAMQELMAQMSDLGKIFDSLKNSEYKNDALYLDKIITEKLRDGSLKSDILCAPLAGSLIPWIDSKMENGQSKEEWKGVNELNKILCLDQKIPADGICVRVGALRCHSQAVTLKLTRSASIKEIEDIIQKSNQWVEIIPNEIDITKQLLTPIYVSGKLTIAVGRIRKMILGDDYLTLFTVGDQLLWGAAEPLRRILRILIADKC